MEMEIEAVSRVGWGRSVQFFLGGSSLGIGTIDMGKGAEPYKQRLMNGAIPIAEGVVAVSPSLTTVRSLRRAVSAWLHRGPLDGLAKKAGKIVGRAETRWRFK